MSIQPIVRSVTVKAPPARAFDLFTSQMGRWWPVGKTVGANPHADIVLEPHVGGRWFERDAAGHETLWGKVLVWQPPTQLLLGWQLNARMQYDPEFVTEVELTFARDGGDTLVTLQHRDLERFGADAERFAGLLGGGWLTRLGDFARYVDAGS